MRRKKPLARPLALSIFVGVFLCLVISQSVAFFYAAATDNERASRFFPGAEVALDEGDHQVAELCKKLAHSTDRNHCSHIGFCVLCSADDRAQGLLDAPPPRVQRLVVFEDTQPDRSLIFHKEPILPPRLIGWQASWSATAPPRA